MAMAMAMPMPTIANVSRLPCIFGRSSTAKPFVASYPFKLFGLRFSAIPQPPLASSTSSYFGGSFLSSTIFGSRSLLLRGSNIVKVKAGKASLGCTKRSKSRLTRARTSGFRARIQTPTGRNVLKRRRAKGRKRLVPATNPNSGKFA